MSDEITDQFAPQMMSENEIESLLDTASNIHPHGEAMIRDLPSVSDAYAGKTDRWLQEMVQAGGGGPSDAAFVELELRMNANLRTIVKYQREQLKYLLKLFASQHELLTKISEGLAALAPKKKEKK